MPIQDSIAENDVHNQNNINNPLSIKGRFSRSSFLAWSFLLYLPFTIPLMIDDFISVTFSFTQFYASIEMFAQGRGWDFVIPILFLTTIIGFFTINAIFLIRRLHDINMSGWFSLLIWLPVPFAFSLLYFISLFNMEIHDSISHSTILLLIRIMWFIGFSFTLFVLVKKGTQGVNTFGFVRETPKWEKVTAIIALLLVAAYVIVSFTL